jgi:hypothetical protein
MPSHMQKPNQEPSDTPLREGVDYYIEKGYFVFTEFYLKKRGYCCGNGCRHCPYTRKKSKLDERTG